MQNRRFFIKKSALATAAIITSPRLLIGQNKNVKITILHTNDMHSHIHAFKKGRNKGLGGMAARASLINKIRQEEKHVLVFDAGDIFQGTPYFNFYNGELELKLMSKMKYDGATLGNHDFDNGIQGLMNQLPNANFPFIISNYDFSKTILKDSFKRYKVFKKGKIRIGVFGIGIELNGLVPKKLYQETIYLDPIQSANYHAMLLKKKEKCDLVICLSHLGFKYKSNKVSDIVLAKKTNNIDLIIGGHTHTFLKKPVIEYNSENKKVLINQVGWGGINIGRIDFNFSQNKDKTNIESSSIFVKNNIKTV